MLVGSARLAGCLRDPARRDEDQDARFLTLTLLSNTLIACVAGTIASFARANSSGTYLGIAVALVAACAARPSRLLGTLQRCAEAVDRTFRAGSLFDRFVIVALGASVLWVTMQPSGDWDSNEMVYYMQSWLYNKTIPYDSPYNYVVFWELSYLPAMAITRNDQWFWITSLKPVLLVAFVLYRLGVELRLPRSLAALAAVNAVSPAQYWTLYSGVMTLKNDMLHACGVALFALGGLRVLRGAFDRESGLTLGAALVFLTVKYSGVPESVAALGLLGVLAGRDLIRDRWRVLRWACLAASAFFLASGHYYLHNLVTFGNPLYPFQLKIGGMALPGILHPAGTSILDNLGDRQLWASFFPTREMSSVGLWFPVTLAGCLLAAPAVLARELLLLTRRRPVRAIDAFLASFLLAFWMLYFRSYWSAGGMPGDLTFVRNNQLVSLRYAEGVLGLSELFLLVLLARVGCPGVVLRFFVLSSLLSRVATLFRGLTGDIWLTFAWALAITGPLFVIGLAIGRRVHQPASRSLLAGLALLLAIPLLVPRHIEAQRKKYWGVPYQPVWRALDHFPKGNIYVAWDAGMWCYRLHHNYIIRGKFDRFAVPVREDELASACPPRADYAVSIRDIMVNRDLSPAGSVPIRRFEARMAERGYKRVAANDFCSLMRLRREGQVAARRVTTPAR